MIYVEQDDNHESIIIARFSQGWSLDELVNALNEIYLLADNISDPIYLIFNLLDAPTLPKVSLSSLRNISLRLHPQIKLIVDVTGSSLIRI